MWRQQPEKAPASAHSRQHSDCHESLHPPAPVMPRKWAGDSRIAGKHVPLPAVRLRLEGGCCAPGSPPLAGSPQMICSSICNILDSEGLRVVGVSRLSSLAGYPLV